RSIRVIAVLEASVVSIFVTALKSLAKVVLVIVNAGVIAVIAEGSVLKCIVVVVISTPAVLAVCFARPESFLVPEIYRAPQSIGPVLIDLVIVPATIIAIDGCCVEVRIVVVIKTLRPDPLILFSQPLQIRLLEAILRRTPFL